MVVTLLGMVTLVILVQPENATVLIVVIPLGKATSVTRVLFRYKFLAYSNGFVPELLLAKDILHHASRSVICTAVNCLQL